MKQLYESEVLFQLMERDGFNIPSSVPPYEAEIKAYLINQVKQAYPKLTDYEAEWLLYNYTKHLPVEFPISTVKNTTYAQFENVVPFAYQSAILTGNTRVNEVLGGIHENISLNGTTMTLKVPTKILKTNTTYWFSMNVISNTCGNGADDTNGIYISNGKPFNGWTSLVNTNGNKLKSGAIGRYFSKLTTANDLTGIDYVEFFVSSTIGTGSIEINNLFICEVDGEESLPNYFEGMQSVKMPVLTTTGKNLFDKDKANYIGAWLGTNGNINALDRIKLYYVECKPNTTYTISKILSKYFRIGYGNDIPKTGETVNASVGDANKSSLTITTNDVAKYLYFNVYDNTQDTLSEEEILNTVQLEASNSATSYEPYKSNILTVNEPIELRGINDVKDELNLLTGELTQRIGEVVLDGSEEYWRLNALWSSDETDYCCFYNSEITKNIIKVLSADKLPTKSANELRDYETNLAIGEGIRNDIANIQIFLAKSKLSTIDVNGLKQYLQSNPITVQYQLATESIKTVDLTTLNESGETVYFMPLEGIMNVSTSSETIQPTFDMTVPVEATTQNLASFINMETEE